MKTKIHNSIEVTCKKTDKLTPKTYTIKIDPFVEYENGEEKHDEMIIINLNSMSFSALEDYLTRLYITKLKMLAAAHPDGKINNPWFEKFKNYITYLTTDCFDSGLPEYPNWPKHVLEYVPRNEEQFDKLKSNWKQLSKDIKIEF